MIFPLSAGIAGVCVILSFSFSSSFLASSGVRFVSTVFFSFVFVTVSVFVVVVVSVLPDPVATAVPVATHAPVAVPVVVFF